MNSRTRAQRKRPRPTYYEAEDDPAILEHCSCNSCVNYVGHHHSDPASADAKWLSDPPTESNPIVQASDVHEPLALAKALSANIQKVTIQSEGNEPDTVVTGLLKDWQELYARVGTARPTESDMVDAFDIFDQLFFDCSVSTISVELVTNEQLQADDRPSSPACKRLWLYGRTTTPSTSYSTKFITELYIDHCLDGANTKHDGETSFLTLCGALLHELCHAFLHLYSCSKAGGWPVENECPSSAACTIHQKENMGSTAHGRAWHHLVKTFEECIPRILGVKLKLWGWEDLQLALSEGWRPSQCDMLTCFTDENRQVAIATIEIWHNKMTGADTETTKEEARARKKIKRNSKRRNNQDDEDWS